MHTTTRLLLPFTEGISSLALGYAVQIAQQSRATLVPLALIPVRPKQHVRLELIQQAQDFLVLITHKATRQGVPIEAAQLYTQDSVRSIEVFAREMHCEAVLLFLSYAGEVLLGHAEIRALMERGTCNIHLVLLPAKRTRRVRGVPWRPLHNYQDFFRLFLPDLLAPRDDNLAASDIQMVNVKLQPEGAFHGPTKIPDTGRI